MKTDPKTDTLLKTYLVYILVLLFGVAIIAKIIVVQTKDNCSNAPRNANTVSGRWRPRAATSSRPTDS